MANGERTYTPCPTVPGSPNKDYSKINETGDWDPYHSSKIEYFIGLDQDLKEAIYVVYLDDKLDVVWCSTNAARKASPGMRAILRRMAFLETMPIQHLERDRQKEYRRLLGEGLALYLSCREDPDELRNAETAAFASFDEAERRINHWNLEYTTRWYFIASSVVLAVVLGLVVVASLTRGSQAAWELIQFAFAGALGGLLLFLVRLRNGAPGELRVEVSGSELGYFTTIGVKTLVAMIGAVLIGVAMKADLLLGVANKNALATLPEPFTISAVAFVVCFVAGFSESLVPRFLNTFETSNDLSGRRAAAKSSSKHASPGDAQPHDQAAEGAHG